MINLGTEPLRVTVNHRRKQSVRKERARRAKARQAEAGGRSGSSGMAIHSTT
jgi:hypothetical protein